MSAVAVSMHCSTLDLPKCLLAASAKEYMFRLSMGGRASHTVSAEGAVVDPIAAR